jgi:RHS repeat-associated protein
MYDMAGRMIAELDGKDGSVLREYIYLGYMPLAVATRTVDKGASTGPGNGAGKGIGQPGVPALGPGQGKGTPPVITPGTPPTPATPSPAQPGLYFFHLDQVGAPQAVTARDGATVWRADWEPFGAVALGQNKLTSHLRFPGQYFDEETGLYYNYHRHYDPSLGRYIESDPIGLAGGLNTYGYVDGDPLVWTDFYGYDAIPMAFPNYKIATPIGRIGELGHAGILLIDPKNGRTQYYEYGRYDDPDKKDACKCGRVRSRDVSNVNIDSNTGSPTPDSLNNVLGQISEMAGQNGPILGAYIKNDKFNLMNGYARNLEKQNNNPKRKPYSLYTNNCGTFMKDVLEAGGVETPSMIDPRPNSYIEELRANYPPIDYNP